MTKYIIIPTFNLNDPGQAVDTIEEARKLAEDFLAKFGGPDCQAITVVEITAIGELELVSPIWHDFRRGKDKT